MRFSDIEQSYIDNLIIKWCMNCDNYYDHMNMDMIVDCIINKEFEEKQLIEGV